MSKFVKLINLIIELIIFLFLGIAGLFFIFGFILIAFEDFCDAYSNLLSAEFNIIKFKYFERR